MLREHILNTVTYYDVMDYPLTSFEIWKHLIVLGGEEKKLYELSEVTNCLENDEELKKDLENFQGFYFLKGKSNLASERIEKEKISAQKLKKLIKVVKFLKFIPFVNFIGATGRVAMKNADKESDLDVLIVFSPKKIFLGRFFITGLLHLMGQRRHGGKIKNRVCLNHFLTSDAKPQIRDIFSSHEYSFILPIFETEKSSFSFEKTFSWVEKYKPNLVFTKKATRQLKDSYLNKKIRGFLEFIFRASFWEKISKKWQVKKIKNNPKTKNKKGIIIVSDKELAFWPEFGKHGPDIWEKFVEKRNLNKLD